jgi:hypothetical protein
VKKNLLSTDKPKKRKPIRQGHSTELSRGPQRKHTSYEKESQAALREAIKKAHSRIVGDVPLRRAANE